MFILHGIFLFQILLSPDSLTNIHRNSWYDQKANTGTKKTKCLSLACYRCLMLMVKTAATFWSLSFTGNVLIFWITLYEHFSNLHWYFPCCKYLTVTHLGTKNDSEEQKCHQKATIWNS